MSNASGLFSTPYVPNFRVSLPSLSTTHRFQAFKVLCSGTMEGAASTHNPPSKSVSFYSYGSIFVSKFLFLITQMGL